MEDKKDDDDDDHMTDYTTDEEDDDTEDVKTDKGEKEKKEAKSINEELPSKCPVCKKRHACRLCCCHKRAEGIHERCLDGSRGAKSMCDN